jgi:cystathionine beta-lyase
MQSYTSSYFDKIIDRRNTQSYKFDRLPDVFGEDDILPLWVADMDFRVPQEVSSAIKKRMEHEIYGYTFHSGAFFQSAVDWVKRRHGWTIQPEWFSFSPGVVSALNFCVMAYSEPGDKVIIQTPVYPPFYTAVSDHQRTIVRNPLKKSGERYEMDFDHLEKIIDDKTKMLILCHPHNPVGRVWTEAELTRLAEICVRHRLTVVCDMIHSDLMLNKASCPSLIDISQDIASQTVSLIAPSKTFNIAGLSTSLMFTSNPVLKEKFEREVNKIHVGSGNIFGDVAFEAAYRYGDQWLDTLIDYLNTNFDLLDEWTKKSSYVRYIRPEGTFLAWLDFSPSGLSGKKLYDTVISKAKVGLNRGIEFGSEAMSFMRINVGCPSPILKKAIKQIDDVLSRI